MLAIDTCWTGLDGIMAEREWREAAGLERPGSLRRASGGSIRRRVHNNSSPPPPVAIVSIGV